MKLSSVVLIVSLTLAGGTAVAQAQSKLETMEPGVITLAIPDFPYPGFIEGTDPTAPTGGYYVDMANDMAQRLGVKIKWIPADFTALISEQFKGYDVSVDSFSITPVRLEKFSMTEPVYAYHQGLMTKKGVKVDTADDIRNLVLGSCGTCDTFQFITNTIQPNKEPRGYDIDITKYDGVLTGAIDGAIGDLPVILSKVATPKYADLQAACQFKRSLQAAWIMQKDSPLTEPVKAALKAAKDEGLYEKWAEKNIYPGFGGVDPDSIPACADF